uniref:Uncharacterized protein n=1 Tax=Oryza rufipogon TaxID=4529 RepID=A0A0E0QKB4_ORYRU
MEHRCVSRGLAGDELRVKTQPGLGRTDNDGSFPLLRALSCRLIPQGWLPSESPILALLSPCRTAVTRWSVTLSGDRSSASLLPDLCVGNVGVWVVFYHHSQR